ncbi:hypothetical protein QQX98_010303 [Neonectria punicea]|uniref:Aminoglycoside phosphotransferase domain-containing protein n=1 Tax=Neonectria punicea TaxID=979145 RepID=A0ABR1GPX3_9HYPO
MRPKIFAYAKFNLDALLSLATRLRGRPCTADASTRPKTGSLNWVIFITFEDGIEWAFRSPRSGPSTILTKESASKMLISEASTLKYLRTHSSVPVPEVYSFSGDYNNEIGVPYILMSKASGRPLSEYDWVELSRISGYPNKRPLLPLVDRDREKIMRQLGAIMSYLSEIHFDKIGSLFEDSDGNYSVGECLSPSLLWQHRDELEGIDRGPFHQESQYFHSLISAFIAHAKELPLTPHSFFAPIPDPFEYPHWTSYRQAVERWRTFCSVDDKVEGSKNRLSFCIAGQFLYEMIPRLTSTNGNFVLSHPDLHLGNIFVDEDFNITSIIDWGSASSSPMIELLATPGLSGSLSPPKESLAAAFRSGFCQRGQIFEPEQWGKAERMWRFARLVRMLSTQDYTHFKVLYNLVYEKESEDIPRLFREQSMQEHGKALMAKLCQDELEEEEEHIEEQEDDEDGHVDESDGPAVARKLTLMSEMNPKFVADKRLWLWIEKALEPADSE